jgi:transposase InsO family protein
VPSVGSVGDSYDNALAETINGLYKADDLAGWPTLRSTAPIDHTKRLERMK